MEADYLFKETDKLITVIIPVYNCKEFLEQAVKSVIFQSYKMVKIILVDDGSTDGSSLLCDELANYDKRIDVLHQKNSGVSEARNAGLRLVLSNDGNEDDYITFLDADDVWEVDWLTPQIKKLMEKGIDLIGLQACKCNHLFTRRAKEVYMQEGEYKGGISSIWVHANQHIGAMLYRVNLIKQYNIRFYSIKASEDKIFSMQCLYLADKICLVNRLMYFYRQNVLSTVHTRDRGISYFIPIIDAYIQSDAEMSQWNNKNRGKLRAGITAAKIYIMDMIEEEWESIHGDKNIKELFMKRSDYWKILETSIYNQIDERWEIMKKHKKKFIIKNRLRAFFLKTIRVVYHIRPIENVVDRKRYPIKLKEEKWNL